MRPLPIDESLAVRPSTSPSGPSDGVYATVSRAFQSTRADFARPASAHIWLHPGHTPPDDGTARGRRPPPKNHTREQAAPGMGRQGDLLPRAIRRIAAAVSQDRHQAAGAQVKAPDRAAASNGRAASPGFTHRTA